MNLTVLQKYKMHLVLLTYKGSRRI